MDDLFTRYMYYERAKQGIKSSTTEALRKFYERNSYALLKNEDTFENLKVLADFWKDVNSQAEDRFSQRVLRQLFMLNYAPNSMWTFFVSVYFLKNKDAENKLDDEKFYKFLQKAIAFIWCYAVTNPGLNALRTPVFAEMVNIIEGKDIDFANFIFPYEQTRSQLENYNFYNGRPITRSMLVWWAMNQDGQELPSLTTSFDIEHIYARNRYEHEKSLSNPKMVDAIGNKSILERKINIRASDYRFTDKRKYYIGYETATGQKKAGTDIVELKKMADYNDFSEKEIVDRTNDIFTQFCNYLKEQNLMH